ncbi:MULTISPECIES: hypothetical protein [Halomonas]|uniref:hypothetical protein n=1 Tax=Halomonas TaxID=2745 RepID=UPI001C971A90|nr:MULTISPECIES: hypothetical protein [Halomonas]MBY6230658.1 hypothetical protein [Halomonas sp. DP3Y7-1]MCA0918715.1 hypothetical protein [Halomonas denitrificans]
MPPLKHREYSSGILAPIVRAVPPPLAPPKNPLTASLRSLGGTPLNAIEGGAKLALGSISRRTLMGLSRDSGMQARQRR